MRVRGGYRRRRDRENVAQMVRYEGGFGTPAAVGFAAGMARQEPCRGKQRGQDCGQHPKVQSRGQWSILNEGAAEQQAAAGGTAGRTLALADVQIAPWERPAGAVAVGRAQLARIDR